MTPELKQKLIKNKYVNLFNYFNFYTPYSLLTEIGNTCSPYLYKWACDKFNEVIYNDKRT